MSLSHTLARSLAEPRFENERERERAGESLKNVCQLNWANSARLDFVIVESREKLFGIIIARLRERVLFWCRENEGKEAPWSFFIS